MQRALAQHTTQTHMHSNHSIVGGCLHYAKRDKKKRFVSIGFVPLYTQDIMATREDGRTITLRRRNGSQVVTRKDPDGSGHPTATGSHAALTFRAPTETAADIWCAWIESATAHGTGGEEGIGVDVSTGKRVAPGRFDPWRLSMSLPLPDDSKNHVADFGGALDKIARSRVQPMVHLGSPSQSQVATPPADSKQRESLLSQLSRVSGRISPLGSTPPQSNAAGAPTTPGSRGSEERQLGDMSPIELASRLGEPPSPSFLVVDGIDPLSDDDAYDNDEQEEEEEEEEEEGEEEEDDHDGKGGDEDDGGEHFHSQHIAARNKSLFSGNENDLEIRSTVSSNGNDEEGMEFAADGFSSRSASPMDLEWNGDEDSSICL